jgi:hypothetical protein
VSPPPRDTQQRSQLTAGRRRPEEQRRRQLQRPRVPPRQSSTSAFAPPAVSGVRLFAIHGVKTSSEASSHDALQQTKGEARNDDRKPGRQPDKHMERHADYDEHHHADNRVCAEPPPVPSEAHHTGEPDRRRSTTPSRTATGRLTGLNLAAAPRSRRKRRSHPTDSHATSASQWLASSLRSHRTRLPGGNLDASLP